MANTPVSLRQKLELLRAATTLGSVSRACKELGFSRDSFYRFRNLYSTGGEAALQEISRKKRLLKNSLDSGTEAAVVAFAIKQPAYGQHRVADELSKRRVQISAAGVRKIWIRHDLETFEKRVRAIYARVVQDGMGLTVDQTRALEVTRKDKAVERTLEVERPGYLGYQGRYFVGILNDIGRTYQQTFIDSYSKMAFVKLYGRTDGMPAEDLLEDRVLPFFARHRVSLLRTVTKNRGRVPLCEEFHQTMQNEFYTLAFRRKRYGSLQELQADVDAWVTAYNSERPYTGAYCYGKTPMQTFIDASQGRK